MKPIMRCLLLLIILVFIAGCAKKIQFADPALAAALAGRLSKSDLAGWKTLYAYRKHISYLDGIEHCTNLEYLELSANDFGDRISPLSGLTNLKALVLHDNQISDISPLSSLTNLQGLHLYNNRISDISPLSNLNNLQGLVLHDNQISNISPLAKLTDLRHLYLGNNRIQDISSLEALTKIGDWDGWLKDRHGVKFHLGLSNNQISDISPLVKNSGIGEGDVIDLAGNPLNDEAYNAHIPILEKRGVVVLY